ncbi:MAG: hypothetical protein M3Q32_05000, partial [Pseudomonadota bacterium]|nr:hypothetical protein [Pseudomonadota bacterium]
ALNEGDAHVFLTFFGALLMPGVDRGSGSRWSHFSAPQPAGGRDSSCDTYLLFRCQIYKFCCRSKTTNLLIRLHCLWHSPCHIY